MLRLCIATNLSVDVTLWVKTGAVGGDCPPLHSRFASKADNPGGHRHAPLGATSRELRVLAPSRLAAA